MHNNPFLNITFGLQHGSYNTPARDYRPIGDAREVEMVDRNPYKYKYNSKEWQDELGLDWYDYGARNYDASLGRWMNVLTDLKARGVEDILITATDNLNSFTQTIRTVFPQSQTQICVVH